MPKLLLGVQCGEDDIRLPELAEPHADISLTTPHAESKLEWLVASLISRFIVVVVRIDLEF